MVSTCSRYKSAVTWPFGALSLEFGIIPAVFWSYHVWRRVRLGKIAVRDEITATGSPAPQHACSVFFLLLGVSLYISEELALHTQTPARVSSAESSQLGPFSSEPSLFPFLCLVAPQFSTLYTFLKATCLLQSLIEATSRCFPSDPVSTHSHVFL